MTNALERVKIRILDSRIGSSWPMPSYATTGSAGLDLRAAIDTPITLQPGESDLVSSGMAFFIENEDYCAKILPRSGLGHKHGIVLGNGTGLVDADYQGPLLISLWNRGRNSFTVEPGDRIAQLVFVPIARPALTVVEAFAESDRGEGGFGSTGVAS